MPRILFNRIDMTLQALQEPHDVCLCLGDLVDYALEPAPCI